MIEVVVVAEGQTEERFIGRSLAPALWPRNVSLQPRLIPTSRLSRGGALSREKVLRYLRNTLRERGDVYVTTFFDLYGLRPNFPGATAAGGVPDPLERARRIEEQFRRDAIAVAECREDRFFAHIQPHEFEALLFSDVETLSTGRGEWKSFLGQLRDIRAEVPTPEHIDDDPQSHPSARLRGLLRPRFEKVLHGNLVAERIGLERIRAECRHFDAWVSRIEALEPLAGRT